MEEDTTHPKVANDCPISNRFDQFMYSVYYPVVISAITWRGRQKSQARKPNDANWFAVHRKITVITTVGVGTVGPVQLCCGELESMVYPVVYRNYVCDSRPFGVGSVCRTLRLKEVDGYLTDTHLRCY